MIVTLEEIKQYLKLDDTEEDNFLQLLEKSFEIYLKNATGKIFNNTNDLAKIGCLVWVCDRYENRSSADLTVKAQNILTYIIIQLSYCNSIGEADES